ncbi:MAG: hypothetical protein H6585_04800 [Flavobacteriales bacterium]|nr:hypothetical protein [Flavobacteriales bacterium]MCB9447647.1 hypothetical protein [Flavobacteriales bacterium]
MSPGDYYEKQINELTTSVGQITGKVERISLFRLMLAGMAITCIVLLFRESNLLLWSGLVLAVGIFVFLVKATTALKEEKRYKEELLKINRNEVKALAGDISSFGNGKEYMDPEHPYSYDMDIFGDGSIFQMLNRTSTRHGNETLAGCLTNLCTDKEEIIARQKAVIELSGKIEWRQRFQAVGQLTVESPSDRGQIEYWLGVPNTFYGNKFYARIRKLVPAVTLAAWVVWAVGLVPVHLPVILSSLQLMLTGQHLKYVNMRHQLIHKNLATLRKFYRLMETIEQEEFSSEYLVAIKRKTFRNDQGPSASFARLIRLVDQLDNRLNMVLAGILNGLFLWDINYMYQIEKWVDEFSEMFPEWIHAIAQFDACSSLAGFMYNHPGYDVPEVLDADMFHLEVSKGGHPLLDREGLVTNDLVQKGSPNLLLITGANMAGKSTFLRMIGVNLVLAMAGTCVCAERFAFTPVKLFTSMRTNDSVQRHTSFFFAELKRLKFIVDQVKQNKMSYIMLDEILKGTNSRDQHSGASKLIENIIRLNGVGMIATHDVDLTRLSAVHPGQIRNIAFEIEMENNEMKFDYTYRDGVCQNMNATMLMEQMNIF